MKKIKTLLKVVKNKQTMFTLKCKWAQMRRRTRQEVLDGAIKSNAIVEKSLLVGGKMMLWLEDEVSRAIFMNEFEVSDVYFVSRYLKKGMTFVDIGANIGLYTIVAARSVGERGRVYSCEPVRETFSRLTQNVVLNRFKNVTALRCAVSNSSGTSPINVIGDGYSAWSSLGNTLADKYVGREMVDTITLDDFAEMHVSGGIIDMIKIDVEGWELSVLAGAEKTLTSKTAPCILIEFTEENAKRNGYTCGVLYDKLSFFGYTMYKYDMLENKLVKLCRDEDYTYRNVICMKNDCTNI